MSINTIGAYAILISLLCLHIEHIACELLLNKKQVSSFAMPDSIRFTMLTARVLILRSCSPQPHIFVATTLGKLFKKSISKQDTMLDCAFKINVSDETGLISNRYQQSSKIPQHLMQFRTLFFATPVITRISKRNMKQQLGVICKNSWQNISSQE